MTPHTHKLKRLKYKSGNIIYFCTLPDCNYKINIALALGKRSICWRCGESFIMDDYSLRLAKPHCESCHRPKVNEMELPGIDSDIKFVTIHNDTDKPLHVYSPRTEELSLRLNQTIQTAQQTEDEDEI